VAHRPIWYSQWLQAGVTHRGYIYGLDGQEYGRDEAAELVTRANETRWTWRAISGEEGKTPRTFGGILGTLIGHSGYTRGDPSGE
jgi:hypothetical protein